ncbi:MAG TPA: YqiA/YcfP family alpha/beta fold hydrolase [Rhodocyclaceae bacterium]|nr:YqiA/YcfP family alpha/beta fold hydrolase [Rhodocyclaceae bacterium]
MGRGLILYLHGFASSPASWKARLLGEAMRERGLADDFQCPSLSHVPAEAVAQAEAIIAAAVAPVTLVGSSLGGHYATFLAEKHGLGAVLINPAIVDRLGPERFVGTHQHYHSGETFRFTGEHADQLAAQCVARPTVERYFLLLETADEVLDYRHAAERYHGCREVILPGGDHSFTRFPDFIPAILDFAGL